jgi:ABC-type antimicrobial peptide transport system, permease component
MFKNYLKVALRNLLRYKGFSTINILSLAIGLTGCLAIALFVWDELQYDKFIKDGENIYRINTKHTDNLATTNMAVVPPVFATYMKQQYPEVENTLRIMMASGNMLLEVGDTKYYEEKWLITEGSFFNFFPLHFVKGEPTTALTTPNSIVITEALSKKYFGTQDPVGKTIKIDKEGYLVKGVLANVPEHFHLDFDFLISLPSLKLPKERMESWQWNQFFTYIKVKPGTNMDQLQKKFSRGVQIERAAIKDKSADTYEPFFQKLKNIHLQSADFRYDIAKRGNETYVKALSIIALFVLLIACFNFINLSTARSFRRAREIGVRKVVGADRYQLLVQFTGESVLLSMLSMIMATGITILLLPSLNNFTGKSISFNPFTHPVAGFLLLAGSVLIGLLAGIYPAMVMSGFRAITVLKGIKPGSQAGNKNSWLRQGLVIIQFALSALLIISTTIVYNQIKYLHEKNLGFNKDQVMFFPLRGDLDKKSDAFKEELKRSANVISATVGYGLPGDLYAGDQVIVPGKEGEKNMATTLFIVDPEYIKTLGLQLTTGRDFSKDMPTDAEEAFIINETAVREFGFETPQKALGQRLEWPKWLPDSARPVKQGRVIGVVKDFHYSSLHDKVGSLVLEEYLPVKDKMAVKVKAADLSNTIAFINSTWNKFCPEYPLEYKFLDESFSKMYKSEDKLSGLLSIFTMMAIFVGCMGLFGLATFTAEQRTKEIGIRKVLGASIMSILAMLSKTFLKPVLIASLIAFPIAWYAMNKWLEDFPYRVHISGWIFLFAALLAIIIALVTVSFQAIKAAVANPVKSLRTE